MLREIRDAVDRMSGKLGGQIDQTNARLDQTNARLDRVIERLDSTDGRVQSLERRVTQGFIETNTKIVELSGRFDGLSDQVAQLGKRLENVITGQFGQDVRDLKTRVLRLEELVGTQAHEKPSPHGEEKK